MEGTLAGLLLTGDALSVPLMLEGFVSAVLMVEVTQKLQPC